MDLAGTRAILSTWRPALLCAALLLTTACSTVSHSTKGGEFEGDRAYFVDPTRKAEAISEAKAKNSKGQRVWCVPFARTMSGVELRGNAGTWWKSAAGTYDRGADPAVGSVMAFSSTGKMPMGHVAVVSEVVSPREILIDHANWSRNKISLQMPVIDVSEKNDWSKVRVASGEGYGSVYPINGFIYPARVDVQPLPPAPDHLAASQDAVAVDAAIEAATAPAEVSALVAEATPATEG